MCLFAQLYDIYEVVQAVNVERVEDGLIYVVWPKSCVLAIDVIDLAYHSYHSNSYICEQLMIDLIVCF